MRELLRRMVVTLVIAACLGATVIVESGAGPRESTRPLCHLSEAEGYCLGR